MSGDRFLTRRMTLEDLRRAQEVGQEAWSELASRELGRRIKYPLRPRRIIESYLGQEPGGCFVAEHGGEVVGTAYCHVWGRIGWFGPFEVVPRMQGKGAGRALLRECEAYLHGKGCQTIGLETMASITRNVDFYLRGGYEASGTSVIMERELSAETEEGAMEPSAPEEVEAAMAEARALSARSIAGADLSGELQMSRANGLGPIFMLEGRGRLRGVAALHSYYPPQDADHVAMRLLMVDRGARAQKDIFGRLVGACEAWAFSHGRRRIFARFSGDRVRMYGDLVRRGYRLDAANVRMCKGAGARESADFLMAAWAG